MPDNDYTPTTDEVREDFAYPWDERHRGDAPERKAAFDRWLAAHDAELREQLAQDIAGRLRALRLGEESRRDDQKLYDRGVLYGLSLAINRVARGKE